MSAAGDQMRLALDFDTVAAIAAVRELTDALRDSKEAFIDLDRAVVTLTADLKDAVNAAGAETDALEAMGRAAEKAAGDFDNLDHAVKRAGENAGNSLQHAAEQTGQIGEQAQNASTAVDQLSMKLLQIAGPATIANNIKSQISEAIEDTDKFSSARFDALNGNRAIGRMLFSENVTEQQVENGVENVTRRAGSTREQARAAVLASGQFGNPLKSGSPAESAAINAASASAAYGIEPADIESLVKADRSAGGDGGQSLKVLIEKIRTSLPKGQDPASGLRAVISGILPELQRGESPNQALAIFGTLAERLDPAQAARGVAQIRRATEGGNPAMDKLFSQGVPFQHATDAEVSQSDAIQSRQRSLDIARRRLAEDQHELADDQAKHPRSRNREIRDRELNAEERAIRQRSEQIEERKSQIEQDQRGIHDAVTAAMGKEDTKRELQAYADLSPAQRLDRIRETVRNATTPEQLKAIEQAVGFRGADAVVALGGDGFRAMQAAIANASAGDFDARTGNMRDSEFGAAIRAKNDNEARLLATSSPGTLYATQSRDRAKATRMTQRLEGKQISDHGHDWAFSENALTNQEQARELLKELEANKSSITAQEYSDIHGDLDKILHGNAFQFSDVFGSDELRLSRNASALGDAISRGRSRPAAPPLPARPAAPSSSGPVSSAGTVHNHFNSVGVVYSAADAFDLPGPLDHFL